MDPLPNVVVRTSSPPMFSLQEDGQWILEFEDAGVAVILSAEQARRINDDYLSQKLGGPFEDDLTS